MVIKKTKLMKDDLLIKVYDHNNSCYFMLQDWNENNFEIMQQLIGEDKETEQM